MIKKLTFGINNFKVSCFAFLVRAVVPSTDEPSRCRTSCSRLRISRDGGGSRQGLSRCHRMLPSVLVAAFLSVFKLEYPTQLVKTTRGTCPRLKLGNLLTLSRHFRYWRSIESEYRT